MPRPSYLAKSRLWPSVQTPMRLCLVVRRLASSLHTFTIAKMPFRWLLLCPPVLVVRVHVRSVAFVQEDQVDMEGTTQGRGLI